MYYSLSVDFHIDDPNQANAIQGVCLHGPTKRLAEWNAMRCLYTHRRADGGIRTQCYVCAGESLHFLPSMVKLNGNI